MEHPAAGHVESSYPPSHPPNLTSHYLIALEEIVADQNPQLRRSRRGHVSKCFWNDNVVAVKILSDDALVDVSRLGNYISSSIIDQITDFGGPHPNLAELEASACPSGLRYLFSR